MKIALAGVSHHTASIELRERVAIDPKAAAALAGELAGNGGGRTEAVVLSTCNRTELYVASPDHDAGEVADRALLALAGADADALAPVAYRLSDDSAALHLFRVAAGLDSLVPGEGEILGQVRDAYEAGAAGPLLDRTFRMALHAGRREAAIIPLEPPVAIDDVRIITGSGTAGIFQWNVASKSAGNLNSTTVL